MYLSGLVRVNDEIRPGRVTVLGILSQAVPMEGITIQNPFVVLFATEIQSSRLQRSPGSSSDRNLFELVDEFGVRSTLRQKSCRFEVSLDMLKSPFFPFPDSLEVGVHNVSFVLQNSTDESKAMDSSVALFNQLKILEKVKVAYDLPIVTDVHESSQKKRKNLEPDAALPIPIRRLRDPSPARSVTRGTNVLTVPYRLELGMVMVNSAEKVRLAGNPNVMVCERGTMFGYSKFALTFSVSCLHFFLRNTYLSACLRHDLIVDPRNFEWMREANCPVVADVTHSLQQPAGKKVPTGTVPYQDELGTPLEGGGVASGGLRELIPCVARTAVAVGVDGIFLEVTTLTVTRKSS
ncbi:hypothetical protein BHE74_00013823 [Ensete ventricosum]|nr:hypothetical protein BHE74_00013823 [Ensete ventricosum]